MDIMTNTQRNPMFMQHTEIARAYQAGIDAAMAKQQLKYAYPLKWSARLRRAWNDGYYNALDCKIGLSAPPSWIGFPSV